MSSLLIYLPSWRYSSEWTWASTNKPLQLAPSLAKYLQMRTPCWSRLPSICARYLRWVSSSTALSVPVSFEDFASRSIDVHSFYMSWLSQVTDAVQLIVESSPPKPANANGTEYLKFFSRNDRGYPHSLSTEFMLQCHRAGLGWLRSCIDKAKVDKVPYYLEVLSLLRSVVFICTFHPDTFQQSWLFSKFHQPFQSIYLEGW